MLAEVEVGLSEMLAGEANVENVESVESVENVEGAENTVSDVSPVADSVDELSSGTLIVEVMVLLLAAVVVIVGVIVRGLAFSCRCSEPQPERQASMSQQPLYSQPGDVHTYQSYPGRQSIAPDSSPPNADGLSEFPNWGVSDNGGSGGYEGVVSHGNWLVGTGTAGVVFVRGIQQVDELKVEWWMR